MEEGEGLRYEDRMAALDEVLRNVEGRLAECLRLSDAVAIELAQRNAELQRRAEQLKRAEQLAAIGYWHADLVAGQVYWSEGLCRLLGFPAVAQIRAIGEIYRFVHPDDVEVVRRAVLGAEQSGGSYTAEFRARTVAGEERNVRIMGELAHEQGRPVANFGVGQDVTPVKQTEAALRQSEARSRRQAKELELIYATAPVGLCVLDDQLRFVHVNARLAEINGVPVEAHLGRNVAEVVPGIWRMAESALRHVVETGTPVVDFEFSGETPALPGVMRWWISQYWPLLDDEGRVTGVNVVVEETTERRRLEEIRRAEKEFRALAENSPDMITRFDRALRRVYTNPAVERIYGIPREALIGKTNEELGLPPELVRRWRGILEGVFETGQLDSEEVIFHSPAGEVALDSRVIPEPGPDGRVESVLVVTRDVTERKRIETALFESEARYRRQVAELETIYRYAPIGLAVVDRQCRYLRINDRLAALNGFAPAQHPGRTVDEVVPSMAQRTHEYVAQVIATGEPVDSTELRGVTRAAPEAERIWSVKWVPLKEEDGWVWGVSAVVEDVTDRKHAEELLFRREQEFEALAERAPDIIARYDGSRRLLYINPAVERITGKPRDWFLGRRPSEMGLSAGESELRERVVGEILANGREQTVEHLVQTPTGDRHFHARLVPEFGADGRVVSALIVDRDVTDLKRAQFVLEELSLHDPLTGAANRRYLSRFIDREWRREVRHRHSVAVVMADIDYFKAYNDRYGHQQGDECLREVSRALREKLRRPTDILVRYGGEEFAVVLLESDMAAATQLAETMHQAVARRRMMHETSPVAPVVTISMGVSAALAHTVTFGELIAAADRALYRAKQNGRNRVEPGKPATLNS